PKGSVPRARRGQTHAPFPNGITLFEQEGDCVSNNSFEVFQVLDTGDALANEIEHGFSVATGVTVLFLNDGKNSYYDDQVIKIPSGKCAKQIGVFKYKSNAGLERTVPIVEIRNK
uniref:hypothetical protein n=1 Tax=Bacteroides acidifaciens TaxID=85831 RepID=UPI003013AAC8